MREDSMETKPALDTPRPSSDKPAIQGKPRLVDQASSQRTKRRPNSISKKGEEQLLTLRSLALNNVLTNSRFTLAWILIVILLQGFHLWGFNLPDQLLYALLAATIGELAKSLAVVMRFLFKD